VRIGIIGAGSLGGAFAERLAAQRDRFDLVVVERSGVRREELAAQLTVPVVAWVGEELHDRDVVLLAVKPQDSSGACAEVRTRLQPHQVVVSVMAGVSLASLGELLGGHRRMVRAMPNLAARIGQSTTAWVASPEVSAADRSRVEEVLGVVGRQLILSSEDLIDPALAAAASGPGYLYYIIEHLMGAAEGLGLDEQAAKELISGMISGAVELWRRGDLRPEELRAMVTSAGGTTAAAIEIFERGRLGETVAAGLRRACERARELNEIARGGPDIRVPPSGGSDV